VAHNSPDLNPLDYHVWGNAGVLLQAATKKQFLSLKCTTANLVCLTGERNQQCRERFPQAIADVCQTTAIILNV